MGFGTAGPSSKQSTFNARAESLGTSALWRRPFHRHRCIIPASGYYEWRKSDRAAFRFTVDHEPTFGLAGLWDAWLAPDQTWLQSFTIITTDPNSLAAEVHNRMPVILHPRDYDEWLSRDEITRPPEHLLRPFDPAAMHLHPAHPRVGNVRNQGPEMLHPEDMNSL